VNSDRGQNSRAPSGNNDYQIWLNAGTIQLKHKIDKLARMLLGNF